MTDKLFQSIWQDAQQITDMDAFVSDWALSSALLPDNAEIDPDLVEQLQILWRIANDPFKSLLSMMGLSQAKAMTRFCINPRTIKHWAAGDRSCPAYIRLLMAEVTGLLRLREYETQKM